jgi:uncharacterized protein
MGGVSDLTQMLRGMEPVLATEPYGITVQPGPVAGAFAFVAEAEGVTVIAPQALIAAEVAWARISLTLHSDLAAVGLTAAFARALAEVGISANVVAGYYHDHIFVQWERREDAMVALKALARDA